MYPTTDVDLFSDEAIRNPYAYYKEIRDAGPLVWMTKYDMWVTGRYAEARKILRDHETFSSASGVSVDPGFNEVSTKSTLSLVTDPPLHDQIRRVSSRPLMPRALAEIEPQIRETANALIAVLVQRGSFDGMKDLSQYLPLNIVKTLVGVPRDAEDMMLTWAESLFNFQGPRNQHFIDAEPHIETLFAFCEKEAVPEKLTPGGWAARIYEAADRGEIPHEYCPAMMREYLVPSLDTTIFGTGHLLRLLGEYPDQWELLKANPTPDMIESAVNEVLRYYSPARSFTRLALRDATFGDVTVKTGDRVALLFACANRDERHWGDPDTFRVERDASSHLAFGHGVHTCMGMHLAKLEMKAILSAMLQYVDAIEVGEPEIVLNNVLTGYAHLSMKFTAAQNVVVEAAP